MRNLRKTRKRGGLQYTPNVYECGTKLVRGKLGKVSVSDCIRDFAAVNNFMVVATADDGNCFYDTLSKYGARSGNPRLNRTHMELRREIIGTMIRNQADYAPYFVEDRGVSQFDNAIAVNVERELRRFLQSRQWAGWMGDIVPQVAANILGVNITIYDLLIREPSNMIDRIEIQPIGGAAAITVNMLRTGGSHFRLLWPRPAAAPAAAAPVPRRRPVVAPGPNAAKSTAKKNAINNLSKAVKEARFNNTRKRSSSLENALQAIAKQERNEALAIKRQEAAFAAAAKRKETAIKAAAKKAEAAKIVAAKKAEAAAKKLAAAKKKEGNESNNEREARNLQRAIEESMRNLKINKMPDSFY